MKIAEKLLLFQELIYISSAIRKKVIEQHHNNTLAKYFRIDKTMKFIVKLSKFKKSIIKFEYDSIMIIINKFIKRTYFISFYEKIRVKKVIYLFKQHIIANHEVSTKIISDKNMRFKSKF